MEILGKRLCERRLRLGMTQREFAESNKEKIMETIGLRIKQLREEEGLSVDLAAEYLKMNVSKYECYEIVRLCQRLRIWKR